MGATRVYWTWGLLALAVLGLAVSVGGNWYTLAAEREEPLCDPFGPGGPDDPAIQDPRVLYHTGLEDTHFMCEGGYGETRGFEEFSFIAQVLAVVRIFFIVGLVGAFVGVVGLLFRARGIVDGKGVIASVAVLSVLSMAFGLTYFALNIAEAHNQEFDAASPEIAFFTFGSPAEGEEWQNVTSGPGFGWWSGVIGTAALGAAFVFIHAPDLRRARDVLLDDEAAAARQAEATERRRHVIERIREGGDR